MAARMLLQRPAVSCQVSHAPAQVRSIATARHVGTGNGDSAKWYRGVYLATACIGSTSLLVSSSRRSRSTRAERARPMATQCEAFKLHMYDHCPFCMRAEIAAGWLGVPYERVLYGYGQGADPAVAGGTGYEPKAGPVALTGFKMLPVIEGSGVPAPEGMVGLPESLEVVSYLVAWSAKEGKGAGTIAPATGRPDIDEWKKKFEKVAAALLKPRNIKMPVKDWQDARDVAYAKWKYTTKFGFNYEEAEAQTPDLLKEMAVILKELEPLLRGRTSDDIPTLNKWGFSMDDIIVLPNLRNLTCVKGVEWPPKALEYVQKTCGKAGVKLYTEYAV